MSRSRWDLRRVVIILIAFFCGGAVPIQVLTLSFGYAQWYRGAGVGPQVIQVAHQFARWYIPLVLIPALVVLVVLTGYCRSRYPDVYPAGLLIHFLNGADFGLFYTFVWGKQGSYRRAVFWAVVWALLVELGMMTLPPMAPMVGPFGVRYAWPQLFLLTLFAHIAYGIVLGLLAEHFLTGSERGWFWEFLRGTPQRVGDGASSRTVIAS